MSALYSVPDRTGKPGSTNFLLGVVYFIFFFCGLTQCFESVILPEIKEQFHLGYQQQMYTVFAKNLPFLLAIPVGFVIPRIGYKSSLAGAMALYSAGTLLLIPGLQSGRYIIVLCAFFTIGLGFTIQMVAGNPLLRMLGPVERTSSRLNFGNALGAFAQIMAPAILSVLIPATAIAVAQKLPYIDGLFAVLAALLAVITVVVSLSPGIHSTSPRDMGRPGRREAWFFRVLARPGQLVGFAAIFLALGMEAALFSMFRNFVESKDVAGLSSHQSQRMFTLYFAVFAAGRLSASWLQRRVRPQWTLVIYLMGAMACLGGVLCCKGSAAVVAVTGVGFFVSILFPTLYAIFLDARSESTGASSGLLTMGFLGCAIVPVLQGRLADRIGLQHSYVTGILVYGLLLLLAVMQMRKRLPKAV